MTRVACIAPYPVCISLWAVSIAVWLSAFPQGQVHAVIQQLQVAYTLALVFFAIFSVTGPIPSLFFRILFRLLFTVWVIGFIALSAMETIKQSAYNITFLFIIGYIDACFEVHGEIRDMQRSGEVSSPIVRAFLRQSTALSVAFVSLVHIAIAYSFPDIIEKLFS